MEQQSKKNIEHMKDLFTQPEAWEKWENNLVFGSIVAGIISLLILGSLINWLLLE